METIEFHTTDRYLLMQYNPKDGVEWLVEKINNYTNPYYFKKTFYLKSSDVYRNGDSNLEIEKDMSILFIVAELQDNNFYKFRKDILGLSMDIFFHKDMKIEYKMFVATKNISIFNKIDNIVSEDIYIGEPEKSYLVNLPLQNFKELIRKFPNSFEIKKYVAARVAGIIQDYFTRSNDAEEKYEKYLSKKIGDTVPKTLPRVKKAETAKYIFILNKLNKMLQNQNKYTELQWQKELLNVLPLLYPKYIKFFKEVQIQDTSGNNKRLDYIMLDKNGNIDLIEIKKPHDKQIMSNNKDRDNYFPSRALTKTIMQMEKYIFYLNKLGRTSEQQLTCKLRKKGLSDDFRVNIINPSGLIIMGRDNELTEQQKNDFEIIKRQYKHISDIITYDDLLNNLKTLKERLST